MKLDGKVTEIEGLLELLDIAAMQENVKKESKMSAENNGQKESLPSGEDSDVIKKGRWRDRTRSKGLRGPQKNRRISSDWRWQSG